jgi:hypothetical protein
MVLRDANIAQVPQMAFDTTPVALPPILDKTSSLPTIYFLVSSYSISSILFIYVHIFPSKDKYHFSHHKIMWMSVLNYTLSVSGISVL